MPNLRKLPSMMFALYALPVLVAGFSTQHIQRSQHIQTQKYHDVMAKKYQPLNAGLDENNNQVENSDVEDNFDGKGLANYLAPYALALGLSIAVTVAFVKFVLMDY